MIKKGNVLLILMLFSLLSISEQANSTGTVSPKEIYIPYVDFANSDVTMDGKADENDFFNFTVTTTAGDVLVVYWRQNLENLHAVLKSEKNAWVALGWNNEKPSSAFGASAMDKSNILIGSNSTVRDDTGGIGTHSADATNNYVSSKAQFDGTYTTFEFIFPLESTDPADNPLTVGSYGYFIFAVGTENDVNVIHGSSNGALYVPNVYIETSKKEGYVSPSSAPFADILTILIALTVSSVFILFKKKN